jgi:Dolichyl-phosphate-mannose-protein mannosyltransferase
VTEIGSRPIERIAAAVPASPLGPPSPDAANVLPGTSRRNPSLAFDVAIVAALGVIAVALRLWQIDRESFWLDEAGRAAIAALPFGQIAHGVAVVELSPPLYHLLLAVWVRLVGDGDRAVRMLSALLVLPAGVLAWSLGREVGGRGVGLAVAALVAVSPFALHYGQEAAMYGLLLPLGLGTIRAAVGALGGDASTAAGRIARSRWLVAYMVLGTLALYTHYYTAFLLITVAGVAVANALAKRSRHGVVIWLAAHVVIALAFVPWLPTLAGQAGLAASVSDWRGVSAGEALEGWAQAILADGAVDWPSTLAVPIAVAAFILGAWRLRNLGAVAWLMVGLVVVPLVLATLASGVFHSFRERGFIAVVGAPWLLLASAVVGAGTRQGIDLQGRLDRVVRVALAAAVVFVTLFGLRTHYAEQKEDWQGAASAVSALADPDAPIFFVHYAAQIPFDRYFHGPQPRIGLPESFDWADGYRARYIVTQDDIEHRVRPAVTGARQAFAVLSHDGGRGSDLLVAELRSRGTLSVVGSFVGVRVVRFQSSG